MEVSLIFPHQIYEFNPCVTTKRKIYLIEDHLYFTKMKFHKQKLVLHRAAMKFYEEYLTKYGFDVEYISFSEYTSLKDVFSRFADKGVKKIHHVETVDFRLESMILKYCKEFKISRKLYDTPNFLIKHKDIAGYFESGKYNMAEFYVKQRKEMGVLVKDGKPLGGKWIFDSESKKKTELKTNIPKIKFPEQNKHVFEAIDYVEKNFPENYGSLKDFSYPVTFQTAIEFLDDFLINRLPNFGIYQDLILSKEIYLFHSVLTPIINIGILSPEYVIKRTMEFHADYDYPLSSLEGFIRQIIGWRGFVRAVYVCEGNKQRTSNFWNFQREIPKSFWDATTGIEPLDNTISKVLQTGWCNKTERLMILGNFMLLCEFNPVRVYEWFMEMFIDSYDWVMVPNIFGMSQFADGGLICSKPNISDSQHILKISDYKKSNWCEIWDALYYRFILNHRNELAANPKMKLIIQQIDNMDKSELNQSIETAENFLKNL
ncbi:MAG: cryptochrome/photolyase family protein [Candidatus Kapabacteria bacterium]|nr:cryptochrome/photolyase family protein [Candidatus Kapabacteria bacterium]